jgi:hypothetical protein
MKKKFFLAIIPLSLFSCSSSNDGNGLFSNSKNNIETFLIEESQWRVAQFIEDGENETDDFQGYLFSFDKNGEVVAAGNGNNIVGTYKVFKDDGKVELSMTFSAGYPFDELTDDWYYISRTENSIQFSDDGDVLELVGTK